MTHRTWNEQFAAACIGSDTAAVVSDGLAWSGDELAARAAGAAAAFDADGLAPETFIPALMDETPAAIAMAVGAALSRRALAPLGTKLPVDDLVPMVRDLGSPILYTSPDRVEQAERIAAGAGVAVRVVSSPHAPRRIEPWGAAPDDVAVVVHTSGTTGRAKPVLMRQDVLAARIRRYHQVLPLGPGDLYSSASPFYHTAGVAMDFTVLGMGAGIIPQDWFSVEGWRRVGRLGMTCALLVPTMIDILLAEGALADAAPAILQYGAAPIHPETLRGALAALPDTTFTQIFGQTEVSPICYLDHDDHLRALAGRPDLLTSVGRAVPGAELAIESPDEEGIGEVVIRCDHVFVPDADGWRRSGDLGTIDDEGYVTLRGRLGDRIVRGGENILPIEIEAALGEHPGVREVAVVGVADRRWGEIVKAVIVPTDPGSPPDPDDLRRFAGERVARFKIPEIVTIADELPRNPSGKILRRKLR